MITPSTIPLYATDDQIAEALFGGDRELCRFWKDTIAILERSGFPQPSATFRGRRYWPAVRAFLDAREGLSTHRPCAPDGEENWDPPPRRHRNKGQTP